ncbi:MAG: hypothetical protein ACFFDF_06935 [Candidatus Odinarchaeota archaeon]
MKKKLTKSLIAASFLITIIAIVTPVMAAGSNCVLFMAIGDDLDINASDLIVGKISEDDELTSVKVVFHQRIYDESGEKVYTMMGMLKNGFLQTKHHFFLCPVFNVWFIDVWLFLGEGKLKTTDTNYPLTYRNIFYFTMPNTGGKFVSTPMLMLLSPSGQYYEPDPTDPMNPATIPWDEDPLVMDEGGWVLVAALWDVGIPMDVGFGMGIFPVGPASFFTKSWGI